MTTKRKRLLLILGAALLLLALAAVLIPDAVVRGSTRLDILSPEAAAGGGTM